VSGQRHMCDSDSGVSPHQQDRSHTNQGSIIWLSGPVCSPIRLCLASLLSVRSQMKAMSSGGMRSSDWTILSILCGGSVLIYLLNSLGQTYLTPPAGEDQYWLSSLLLNLIGYSTVLLPGYYVIQYIRQTNYLELGQPSFLQPLVRLCVKGAEADNIEEEVATTKEAENNENNKSVYHDVVLMGFCASGLLVSFCSWGYLQEKIMTTNYVDSLGNKARYKNSQFLVFVNRILAFFIAITVIMLKRQPRHKAPLYKYSYCSFSNIMSSWCQYEALKYVSFPTQVLAKASKIIPVMLMGKVVSNKKYEYYEYVVAVLISLGMMAFLMGNEDDKNVERSTTFAGFIILIGYMCFDSFTSNWQSELFNEYSMSPIQMMAGVNLFSCLLTSVSLFQQGIFYSSLAFMSQYSRFLFDCIILSICSAVGQNFIYFTINKFGPVAFVIIMTVRQVVAVILSCIMFQHSMAPVAILGIFIIFSALFLNIYCRYKMKMKKKSVSSSSGKV